MNKYAKEKELVSHYDTNLRYYSPISSRQYFMNIVETFDINISNESTVLDVGCGDGRVFEFIKHVKHYTGVDYSANRIQQADNKYSASNNCNFVNSCAREFCLATQQKFDLITAFEFLEHIVDPGEMVNIMLTTQPQAKIIATLPVNMPYEAHLTVWKTVEEVYERLAPARVVFDENKRHFMCLWHNV